MTAQDKNTIKDYFETLEKEEWRSIPGHEPYEASSFGRVRNGSDKILTPVVNKSRGHLTVKVGGGRTESKKYVQRLVLMAFEGGPPEGRIACHKNDIKTDNRLRNLYWGTHKSNTEDAIRNGKFSFLPDQPQGERNQNAKYSDQFVAKIRSEYTGKRGEMTEMSTKYGVPISTLFHILKGLSRRVA